MQFLIKKTFYAKSVFNSICKNKALLKVLCLLNIPVKCFLTLAQMAMDVYSKLQRNERSLNL